MSESHIASVIVRSRPGDAAAVISLLSVLPGAEVFGAHAGRIIVVLEAADDRGMTRSIDEIRDMRGVLAVSLVYHHAEPA